MSDGSPRTEIRRRGPQPIARDAFALLRGQLSKRGFAEMAIVTHWKEIAGSGLAAHCIPQKMSSAANGGSTLTLLADDRASLELQHQAPKLIEKINSYFGRTIVAKIKVVAGDLPRLPSRRAIRPLTAAENAELSELTSRIEDAELREALTRLGRNVLGESRKTAVFKR